MMTLFRWPPPQNPAGIRASEKRNRNHFPSIQIHTPSLLRTFQRYPWSTSSSIITRFLSRTRRRSNWTIVRVFLKTVSASYPPWTTTLNIIKHATSAVRNKKKDLERRLDMGFTVIISMPTLIVPFERLSPKRRNFSTTRVLKQISKAELYQTLSENGSVPP